MIREDDGAVASKKRGELVWFEKRHQTSITPSLRDLTLMQAKIEKVCKGGGQARGKGLASVTAEPVWARSSA
eukprot:12910974-Prorocentrum_lima.AAC.1